MHLNTLAVVAMLCFLSALASGDQKEEAEKEKAAEKAARAKEWEERVREDAEAQAQYWQRKAQEDAVSRAEAKTEMAQLKEKAKGLTTNSTPQEVEQALGKVRSEYHCVWGERQARSKRWSYLYHGDDDAYLRFQVEFGIDPDGKSVCTVRAVEKSREEEARGPKHVLEGTYDAYYYGYPSDEEASFSCKEATIDGKAVGKVPFIVAHSPRVSGRMGPGAKVKIIYYGAADDLAFLGPGALRLESMSFTGSPDLATQPPPEEDPEEARRESEAAPKIEYRFPPQAQKTVDLLKREIVPVVDYDETDATVVFADISRRLEKLGVAHGFVVRIPEPPAAEPKEPVLGIPDRPLFTEPKKVTLHLRNIPLFELMSYFGDLSYWGWVLYLDGSIGYTDSQCACGYPKDGRSAHAGRFSLGLRAKGE